MGMGDCSRLLRCPCRWVPAAEPRPPYQKAAMCDFCTPPIDRSPFMRIPEDMMAELNAARVWPDTFMWAVTALADAVLGQRGSEQQRTQSWKVRFLDWHTSREPGGILHRHGARDED